MWGLRWFVYGAVPAEQYTLLGAVVFVPNLAVALWRGRLPAWILAVNLGAAILAVTIGIHFGGGVDNVSGPLLYALLIGLAGLMASGRAAFGAALGSTALYGALVWAERSGLLQHHLPYSKSGEDALATVIAVGTYLLVVAWLVSYTVSQIHRVHRRLDDLRADAVNALSHDLKNPLGIIHSAAEMAAEAEPREVPAHLERIQRGVLTALGLVHNVLDAAALDQHMMQPRLVALDLRKLVGETVDLYGSAAAAKRLQVTTELADDLPPLRGDAPLLGRALGNLLSNAIKFTPEGGSIAIRVVPHGDGAAVTVCDTGRGIRPEDRTRLFQKFSRIESGARQEGTGLGLYIVRAIVEAHGGQVSVDGAAAGGTEFVLELPRDPAAGREEERRECKMKNR